MALASIPGLGFLSKIDFAGFLSKTSRVVGILILLIIVAGIIAFIYYRRQYNAKFDQNIHLFEDINNKPHPIKDDVALLMTIPGTNVKVLYLRGEDVYLPKGSRKMGKNAYWYGINKFGDYVNFDLKSLNEAQTQAGLDFNTEGAKLLYANMNRLLQEEYKNKNLKWWKEYKEIISLIILIIFLTGSIVIIFNKVNTLAGTITAYEIERDKSHLDHQERDKEILNLMTQIQLKTGYVKAGP